MSLVTTDDLLDLRGIAQRQAWFRFDALDQSLVKIGEVDVDSDPTITVDTSRATIRSLSGFTLAPDQGEDFDEIATFIQPRMVLENGDSAPLGTFRFIDARRIRTNLGIAFEGSMADQTIMVDVESTYTFGLDAGDVIGTAIEGILTDRGLTSFTVDATGIVAGTPIAWPAGTSWLRIVNELAGLSGCLPLYFEAAGRGRVRIIPDLAADDPSVTYEDGLNVFETGIATWNDLLTAPNQFVVIESGAVASPIKGVYDLPPSAPNSAFHTGFVRPRVINEQGLQDVTTANERARLAAFIDGAVFEHLTFDAPPDWRLGTFDAIDFRGDRWAVEKWALTCREGTNLGIQASRVYA